MKLYKCILSGDEMFSDVYKIKVSDDGIFYEVEGKSISRKEGEISDDLLGANASSDEPSESFETTTIRGVDIVLNHNLVETTYNKKQYSAHVKQYVAALVQHMTENNPARVDPFKENAKGAVTKVLKDFANFQFFCGQSLDANGMVGLLNYREDGSTPYMLFFKDGLEEEKL